MEGSERSGGFPSQSQAGEPSVWWFVAARVGVTQADRSAKGRRSVPTVTAQTVKPSPEGRIIAAHRYRLTFCGARGLSGPRYSDYAMIR